MHSHTHPCKHAFIPAGTRKPLPLERLGATVKNPGMARPRKPSKPSPDAPKGDQGRVSVTVRLRPDQARALRLHAAMQRIDNREPGSVQGIVEVALDDWLRAHAQALKADLGQA